MTTLDTTGLGVNADTARAWDINGHRVIIALHGTRWRWEITNTAGHVIVFGDENSPYQAARFAAHALEQLVSA